MRGRWPEIEEEEGYQWTLAPLASERRPLFIRVPQEFLAKGNFAFSSYPVIPAYRVDSAILVSRCGCTRFGALNSVVFNHRVKTEPRSFFRGVVVVVLS